MTRDSDTGRILCRSARFLVPFEATDAGPSGVAAVRLYFTADEGKTWNMCGERPEAKGAFEFIAPADGTYGFTVEAVDKAGNIERKDRPVEGSKPEITVVVDTKAPQIEPIFPRQDMELVPGAHMRVRFRVADANPLPSSASVSVRKDDMQTWAALPNVTFQDNEFFVQGDILFAGTYEVRLSAADRAGNSAQQSFTFTCTPNARPPVKDTGPIGKEWEVPIAAPPRAKTLAFEIDYAVEDIGGQPPAAVGLWYTTDAGNSWQFYGRDVDVTSPFPFQAPVEGIYGFKLTSTTRSGVAEAPPKPGVKPDMSTLVDVTYPTLMLDDPRGGESYPGGEVHYVEWTARDEHFGSLPISIYVARDGGAWELLAADLPNTGSYGWNVPRVDYAQYRLKVEARDQVGNTTTVISDNFNVVSAPPETRIRAIIPAAPLIGVAEVPADMNPVEREASKQGATPVPAHGPEAAAAEGVAGSVRELVDKATGMRLRGDYEGAEAALRTALRLDTNNVAARNELGALMIQQGRHSEAVEILRQARIVDPRDTDILYNLASAHYALGEYADAASAFETISVLDPRNEAALWNLAKARYTAKDTGAARKAWQKIVEMNAPGSPFAQRARQALASVPEPKAQPPAR